MAKIALWIFCNITIFRSVSSKYNLKMNWGVIYLYKDYSLFSTAFKILNFVGFYDNSEGIKSDIPVIDGKGNLLDICLEG